MIGGSWMFLWMVLVALILIGFAYVIMLMSMKETGPVRTVGQVIAWTIAVVTAVLFIYGASRGGSMMCQYGGGMRMDMMKNQKPAEKMMQGPQMKKMMDKTQDKM
jgi:hypothetical protein